MSVSGSGGVSHVCLMCQTVSPPEVEPGTSLQGNQALEVYDMYNGGEHGHY
jgi:hypothetical protein